MINKDKTWRGYDFDELQFRRIFSVTQIELEKHKIDHDVQSLYGNKGRTSSLFSGLSGAMSYLDYGIIAFRLGRRLIKLFKKK